MDVIRRNHNNAKRELLKKYIKPKSLVLDVGCGQGGDILKWKQLGVYLAMIDPHGPSLEEARRRLKSSGYHAGVHQGFVQDAPDLEYDAVCCNFALHYIFKTHKNFIFSMEQIARRVCKGGVFLGCIPDSVFITMNPVYKDKYGNTIAKRGDTVDVMLVDTPYYTTQDGKPISRPEPIAHKELLLTWMENNGFRLLEWSPICKERTGTISDLYSQFCFLRL